MIFASDLMTRMTIGVGTESAQLGDIKGVGLLFFSISLVIIVYLMVGFLLKFSIVIIYAAN